MGILAIVLGAGLFLVVGVLLVKFLVWVSNVIEKPHRGTDEGGDRVEDRRS